MPRNTRFHNRGTHTLAFIIDDQSKAADGIMNIDVNGAISVLQRIAQGFSSNLNDLFANTSSYWNFRSMDIVLNSPPPLFGKWRCRKGKRLV
jgi:hypothetical protein